MADTKTCTCAQCGVQFETERKKKYCCLHCTQTAMSRRKGKKPRAEHDAEMRALSHRTCPACGNEFKKTRHDTHSKGPQTHCSVLCAQRARHAERNERKRVEEIIKRERWVYKQWAWAAKRRLAGKATNTCNDCGAVAPKRAQRCDTCRQVRLQANRIASRKRPSARASKARAKALRRSRLSVARVETFDPFEVFARDGWRCHLCGVKTPKRLRGTYEDCAPELDHIIPLALGGEHSRRNTACSCRKCNIEKGAQAQGQLRLIA